MSIKKINKKDKTDTKTGWDLMIEEAQRKIAELRSAIRVFRKNKDRGESISMKSRSV